MRERREKKKKLNLYSDKTYTGAQFFLSNKIQWARDYNKAKETQKEKNI